MSLKIIFMGTPEFSVPIFKSINKSKHQILTVYTQPPKKKSRGLKISKSSIHAAALEFNIPVRSPEKISVEEIKFIKNSKPDVVIVVAYGKILPKELLKLSDIKFLNIHASLLPRWRGAAPIQRAIMNQDKESGISIMKIIDELDAGPVMHFEKIKITNETTYKSLGDEMSDISSKIILDCLKILEKKEEKFIPQDESKITYANKIKKSEMRINCKDKARDIVAKINALYPEPGSWIKLNGDRIKILKAKEINADGNPGEIINDKFIIACSENAIQVLEVQKEGKKSMSVVDFLSGNKVKAGTILDDV